MDAIELTVGRPMPALRRRHSAPCNIQADVRLTRQAHEVVVNEIPAHQQIANGTTKTSVLQKASKSITSAKLWTIIGGVAAFIGLPSMAIAMWNSWTTGAYANQLSNESLQIAKWTMCADHKEIQTLPICQDLLQTLAPISAQKRRDVTPDDNLLPFIARTAENEGILLHLRHVFEDRIVSFLCGLDDDPAPGGLAAGILAQNGFWSDLDTVPNIYRPELIHKYEGAQVGNSWTLQPASMDLHFMDKNESILQEPVARMRQSAFSKRLGTWWYIDRFSGRHPELYLIRGVIPRSRCSISDGLRMDTITFGASYSKGKDETRSDGFTVEQCVSLVSLLVSLGSLVWTIIAFEPLNDILFKRWNKSKLLPK